MHANDAYLAHYHNPPRARLRGLARNPSLPVPLLLRVIEHPERVHFYAMARRSWSDDAVEALATHPDPKIRAGFAKAAHLTPQQRSRLVDDPVRGVRAELAEGPWWRPYWERSTPLLPTWAYERLAASDPAIREILATAAHTPQRLRAAWTRAAEARAAKAPADEAEARAETAVAKAPAAETEARAKTAVAKAPAAEAGARAEAGVAKDPAAEAEAAAAMARSQNEFERCGAAADPSLPAGLVAELATDPSPYVRLAVSMRQELTEQQRAAIDYEVRPSDRIQPADWAKTTADPEALAGCVGSAHIGLRRSVAYNPHLTPEMVSRLAADDDFAVRLLLCENHTEVPGETVLATYLEAKVITRGDLLRHPSFPHGSMSRYADDPDPLLRALVVLDPGASPALIERLSNDEHPGVRRWVADDARLSPGRVLALLDEPPTAEPAAANPNLPVHVMERICAEADHIVDEDRGERAIYLGFGR